MILVDQEKRVKEILVECDVNPKTISKNDMQLSRTKTPQSPAPLKF
jgi:hypothetical protein